MSRMRARMLTRPLHVVLPTTPWCRCGNRGAESRTVIQHHNIIMNPILGTCNGLFWAPQLGSITTELKEEVWNGPIWYQSLYLYPALPQLLDTLGSDTYLCLWNRPQMTILFINPLQAPMKVGDQFLASSITIMESSDMNFLFGLDMLRRHQCQIDLQANVLRFTNLDIALPFLQISQLPASEKRGISDRGVLLGFSRTTSLALLFESCIKRDVPCSASLAVEIRRISAICLLFCCSWIWNEAIIHRLCMICIGCV